MSIESITKRIADEAQAFAEKVIAEAESQKNDILSDARISAEKVLADAKARAEKDSQVLVERRKSVAGLESRKMELKAKQEIIRESFDRALEKLLSLDEGAYMDFISNQLKSFEGQNGDILLNSADKSKYGAKLAQLVENTGIGLSDEEVDIQGGFILKQGDISINCSIEKLLEDKKEEMLGQIAQKLFPTA